MTYGALRLTLDGDKVVQSPYIQSVWDSRRGAELAIERAKRSIPEAVKGKVYIIQWFVVEIP